MNPQRRPGPIAALLLACAAATPATAAGPFDGATTSQQFPAGRLAATGAPPAPDTAVSGLLGAESR